MLCFVIEYDEVISVHIFIARVKASIYTLAYWNVRVEIASIIPNPTRVRSQYIQCSLPVPIYFVFVPQVRIPLTNKAFATTATDLDPV